MIRFQIFLPVIALVALLPCLRAQDLSGSTTIDVDPSTNIVTATCETDMADGDYESDVGCIVTDGAGNIVAQQGYIDHYGVGYAQVVLTFQGQLGTNYIATSSHIAIFNITDLPETGGPLYYEDFYNYSSFEQAGADTYPDDYIWEGPGPLVQTRKSNAHVGNTTAATAIAPTITMAFTPGGQKNSQDHLSFLNDPHDCSETFGPWDCQIPGWWKYNLEGTVAVNDDASKWSVNQTKSSIFLSGNTKDANGVLYPFSKTVTFTDPSDGPDSAYLQNQAGSKAIFWLDAPGRAELGDDGNPIDSLNWLQSYAVHVCSTIVPTVCSTQAWYVQLIVDPGSLLNSSTSVAALGSSN